MANVLNDIKHIGPIADSISDWDGAIGDALELSYEDREVIKEAHPGRLDKQKRKALTMWKQRKNDEATGDNLARAFQNAGFRLYADNVRRICSESGGGGGAPGTSTAASGSAANISSDNPLSLPKIFKILMPVSNKWRNIGAMLSVSHGRLTAIETRCGSVHDDCLREMLTEWLEQTNPPPTKSALVEAVETYNTTLAEKISAL